jgi:hypothetical protein
MNVLEIPSAIKRFLKHFFGCRHCSENFMKETADMNLLDSKDKYAAVVYIWKSKDFFSLFVFFLLLLLIFSS